MTDLQADAKVTEDVLLGGRIRIRQPARGYRVNVDTLLLAAAVQVRDGARVVELGCGVGTALLAVAKIAPESARFTGIEREPRYAALARENVAINELDGRVAIVEADALDPRGGFELFDTVLLNPPYDAPGDGRTPGAGKEAAFVGEQPIEAWIKIWSNRMRADAELTLIHRAQRLGDILRALEGRLGGVEVLPLRPTAEAPAHRVLVRARKGSRAALNLYRGLDLHPVEVGAEKYTPEAEAILRGVSPLRFE